MKIIEFLNKYYVLLGVIRQVRSIRREVTNFGLECAELLAESTPIEEDLDENEYNQISQDRHFVSQVMISSFSDESSNSISWFNSEIIRNYSSILDLIRYLQDNNFRNLSIQVLSDIFNEFTIVANNVVLASFFYLQYIGQFHPRLSVKNFKKSKKTFEREDTNEILREAMHMVFPRIEMLFKKNNNNESLNIKKLMLKDYDKLIESAMKYLAFERLILAKFLSDKIVSGEIKNIYQINNCISNYKTIFQSYMQNNDWLTEGQKQIIQRLIMACLNSDRFLNDHPINTCLFLTKNQLNNLEKIMNSSLFKEDDNDMRQNDIDFHSTEDVEPVFSEGKPSSARRVKTTGSFEIEKDTQQKQPSKYRTASHRALKKWKSLFATDDDGQDNNINKKTTTTEEKSFDKDKHKKNKRKSLTSKI